MEIGLAAVGVGQIGRNLAVGVRRKRRCLVGVGFLLIEQSDHVRTAVLGGGGRKVLRRAAGVGQKNKSESQRNNEAKASASISRCHGHCPKGRESLPAADPGPGRA